MLFRSGLSLTEETPAGKAVSAVDPSDVDEIIATRFGLEVADV